MAIPPLIQGMLPPGIYPASLQEIWAAFDQPNSNTRADLNRALQHAVTLIWSRDPIAILYINGSYVTAKIDPVDVDVAVRSDVWDDATFLAAFSTIHPGEEPLVDLYCNPTQSVQHMEVLFQEVQGSILHKGVIQLLP